MQDVETHYRQFIEQRTEKNLMRGLIDVERPSSRLIKVEGQEYINFSSNDYLGLSKHPALIEGSKQWAEKYGVGCGASRLVTGNIKVFTQLEEKIAQFKGKDSALIMASGFQANASVLPALFDKNILGAAPLVFADKLIHASMHLGCEASGINQTRYRHNDMAHLEELLELYKDSDQPKFILTESVFSMDGDTAPLKEIYALAKKYNCFTIIDEAHATGILGVHGQGLAQDADLVIGTFSKAFGSFGAYIACTSTLKDYLINKCSGIIYATALPPTVLGSINAALTLMPAMNDERAKAKNLASYFRTQMQSLGFDVGASKTHIVPIMIGSSENSLLLSATLRRKNIWASSIRPPTVSQQTARIRFTFTATHTENDLDLLIDVLKKTKQVKAA